MSLIRPRQRVLTGVNPHDANYRYIVPNRGRGSPIIGQAWFVPGGTGDIGYTDGILPAPTPAYGSLDPDTFDAITVNRLSIDQPGGNRLYILLTGIVDPTAEGPTRFRLWDEFATLRMDIDLANTGQWNETSPGSQKWQWTIIPTPYLWTVGETYRTEFSGYNPDPPPAGDVERRFSASVVTGDHIFDNQIDIQSVIPGTDAKFFSTWDVPDLVSNAVRDVTGRDGIWSFRGGTDVDTGQTFGTNDPHLHSSNPSYDTSIWGYPARMSQMCLSPSNISEANDYWEWGPVTLPAGEGPDPGNVVTPQPAYRLKRLGVWGDRNPQSPYRMLHDELGAIQAPMVYQRMKFRWDPTMDLSASGGYFISICSLKLNNANESADGRLNCQIAYEGGEWLLKGGCTQSDGSQNGVWGTDGTPTVTCVPGTGSTVDGFYGGYWFSHGPFDIGNVSQPNWGEWWTIEFAYRLHDTDNNKQGGGPDPGFYWVATTRGTAQGAAPNGTGIQRFYVEGQNMNEPIKTVGKSGASFNICFSIYSNMAVEGKGLDIGSLEMFDHFPADASEFITS